MIRTNLAELWRYRWVVPSLALNSYVLVELSAPLWQYIAIPGCVIFAAVSGVIAAEGWRDRQFARAAAAGFLFALTLCANIYVAIQAAALTHDATIGSRAAKLERTTYFADKLAAKHETLKRKTAESLGQTEGQIQAEIAKLQATEIYRSARRSAKCTNDTAPDSRALCDQLRDYRGRLDAARRATELRGEIDQLEKQRWAGTTTIEPQLTDADPGAKAIALLTGISEKFVVAGFAGYLAVLLELIAAISPALCSPVVAGSPAVRQSDGLVVVQAKQLPGCDYQGATPKTTGKPSSATKSAAERRKSPVVKQVVAGSRQDRQSVVEWQTTGTIDDPKLPDAQAQPLYDAYTVWCRTRGMQPANLRIWGETMKKDLGRPHYRNGSRITFYRGIAPRPELRAVRAWADAS